MIDLDALVLGPCVAVWGTPVVYTASSGQVIGTLPDGSPLSGVFEAATKEFRPDRDGGWTDTTRPTLGIRISDLVAAGCNPAQLPTAGELMLINGLLWSISDVPPPDSAGHLHISLMATST